VNNIKVKLKIGWNDNEFYLVEISFAKKINAWDLPNVGQFKFVFNIFGDVSAKNSCWMFRLLLVMLSIRQK
jgi:hypothetical protein